MSDALLELLVVKDNAAGFDVLAVALMRTKVIKNKRAFIFNNYEINRAVNYLN